MCGIVTWLRGFGETKFLKRSFQTKFPCQNSDWNILRQLSERLAFIGIMGDQLRPPEIPRNIMALCGFGGP